MRTGHGLMLAAALLSIVSFAQTQPGPPPEKEALV
jgi:hypothetical protein